MTEYFGLTKQEFAELDLQFLKARRDFAPYERWQLETAEAEQWRMPDPSNFDSQAKLYSRISTLFTAIDIVASCAALTDFEVARLVVGKEPKDIPNHDFEQLLRNPNPLDSRYEFLYATIAFYKLTGNSYWWLNRKDEDTPPDEMWVIPSNMIIPVPDGKMFLKGYLYYPGTGMEIFLPPHEIVQFKSFNPFSRFIGKAAAMESLSVLAQSYLGMLEWQSKVFNRSNGRLPGILTFEQMVADPTWDKIKRDTKEANENRNLLMLRGVGQGVSWLQNNNTQKDMEFYTGLDAIDKKIMDAIAPGAYTMLFENANEANSRTGRATLNELAIYPIHVMMGEAITNKILPAYPGRPLIGHFEDIRVTDRQLELNEQMEYAKSHTFAEIREEFYGDDPLGDDRDDLLPEQIKTYKSAADQKLELEKKKIDAQNAQARNNQPAQQAQAAENQPPQTTENAQKLDAIGKYERYALRNIGKALKFQHDELSDVLIREIALKFTSCKSEADVKGLFKAYKMKFSQPAPAEPKQDDGALLRLAESIDAAVKATKEQQSYELLLSAVKNNNANMMPNNFYIQSPPSQPPAQVLNHFTMPEQTPPNNYYSITPTIEAGKPADVRVETPVYFQPTIEAAAAPNVDISAPVYVNTPEQPAPVVNIENRLPEQTAPIINMTPLIQSPEVTVKVDAPAVKVDAPTVNVTNEIKTPKIKRTRSKVVRDEKNNIVGQDTTYEHEE